MVLGGDSAELLTSPKDRPFVLRHCSEPALSSSKGQTEEYTNLDRTVEAFLDFFNENQLTFPTRRSWMLVSAAVLGVFTLAGMVTPSLLFLLTFILGLGSVMNAPALQAIIPELVPRDELPRIGERILAFHIGNGQLAVTHLIAEHVPRLRSDTARISSSLRVLALLSIYFGQDEIKGG
jgi:MFS family permease